MILISNVLGGRFSVKIQKCLSKFHTLATKSSKPRRKIREYSDNRSIARMREDGHVHCKTQSVLFNMRTDHIKDLVSDHSFRRVQLFYMTAIVYHNENCEVSLDKTISQIGKSSCEHCSAAHHAILPRLKDNFFPLLRDRFKANPADTSVIEKMSRLGIQIGVLTQMRSPSQIDQFFQDFMETQRDRLIHKKSHMQYRLDSTIVMPKQVNEYDCIIEAKMRPLAANLIQAVSNGLDPYEATHQFVHLMHEFYQQSFASTTKVMSLLKERNLLLLTSLTKGQNATISDRVHWIKQEIKKQPHARNVLKRGNAIDILKVDLEIIALQKASTVMPPREFLDLGMTYDEIKWTLLSLSKE